MNITARQRVNDWIAFLTNRPGTWEAGRTEAEAIGKLIISVGKEFHVNVASEPTPLRYLVDNDTGWFSRVNPVKTP